MNLRNILVCFFQILLIPLMDLWFPTNLPKEVLSRVGGASGVSKLKSPMTGKVLSVDAKNGDEVSKGDCLMIIEAMKMENRILAPSSGVIEKLKVKAGDQVQANSLLCEVKAEES